MSLLSIINRYPMKVDVYQPMSGGGIRKVNDRMGVFQNRSKRSSEYRLKKLKAVMDPQKYSNFIFNDKGKQTAVFWSPAKGVVEPMTPEIQYHQLSADNITGFKLTANEIAWKENFMNNVERIFIVFNRKGFLDKYMPLVMLIFFGFIMLMTFVVVRQDLIHVIDTASSAISGAIQNVPTLPPIPE